MFSFQDMKKMLEAKEKQKGKTDTLEKNDFKALLIAAFSVFGPTLLLMLVFFGLIIFVITLVWK